LRRYFFTEVERRRLLAWLDVGAEDAATRMLLVEVRRSLRGLGRDAELLVRVSRALRARGRMDGRARLPRGFGSASRRGGCGSTRRGRGRSTSAGWSGSSGAWTA